MHVSWAIRSAALLCWCAGVGFGLPCGHRTGAVLALALLPVGAVFWWGFVLPFAPPPAVVRTVLIILLWGTLT